jgi:hypothetical protein
MDKHRDLFVRAHRLMEQSRERCQTRQAWLTTSRVLRQCARTTFTIELPMRVADMRTTP